MIRVFEATKKIADAPVNVLILGASGTGKELIARSIHANSEAAQWCPSTAAPAETPGRE